MFESGMDLTGWVTQERFNEYMVAANLSCQPS